MMSRFWPEGIDIADISSPMEILEAASEDWVTESKGALKLLLQETETDDEELVINVHALDINHDRTMTLFRVVHRRDYPYPLTIQFKNNSLPVFLKKRYFAPGADIPASASDLVAKMAQGRTVEN